MSASEESSTRVALVTGAAGAIGSSICGTLRTAGLEVVGVDLQGAGCIHADVATEAGVKAMIDATLARHGRLDVLVLNAGVQHMAPIDEFPTERWDAILGVLVTGPFLAIRYGWAALTAHRGSRIIAIGSALSLSAEPYKAAYVAGKHAIWGLIKVAAIEGGPHALTANVIAPGRVWTPLMSKQITDHVRLRGQSREAVLEELVARYSERRFVTVDEVASLVEFLASERSSGITGTCLPVDLGYQVS